MQLVLPTVLPPQILCQLAHHCTSEGKQLFLIVHLYIKYISVLSTTSTVQQQPQWLPM